MIRIDEFSVGCKRLGLKLQPLNLSTVDAMNIGVAYFQQMQALVTDKSVPCRQYQMCINQQPTPWNVKQSTETKISLSIILNLQTNFLTEF